MIAEVGHLVSHHQQSPRSGERSHHLHAIIRTKAYNTVALQHHFCASIVNTTCFKDRDCSAVCQTHCQRPLRLLVPRLREFPPGVSSLCPGSAERLCALRHTELRFLVKNVQEQTVRCLRELIAEGDALVVCPHLYIKEVAL